MRILSFLLLIVLGCAESFSDGSTAAHANRPNPDQSFEWLMRELARGWNEGDAAAAAACFTADAVYSNPPDKQLYRGHSELFEFFGGEQGRAGQMEMVWHHLSFDPDSSVGFGEFSFTYGSTAHGVAVVRLRDGKIANWREYWYESELPWDEFVSQNPF